MAISFKERMANAIFGTPVQGLQPESSVQVQYPTQRQADFMNNFLNNEQLIKDIQASPHYQGYSDQELFNRVAQGQNFGLKNLADEQSTWVIKLPRAGNEYDNAALEGNYLNVYQPKIQTGIANEPRQGGIIRDFMTGARENYNEGFNPENWGQKKNWATRLGEGLGTLARFGDSSLGRGIIAGGLIGALGGTPTEMAAYGLSAGVGRQQSITKDRAYRQGLRDLGYDEETINSIPYNMLDDAYKNLATAKYQQGMADDRKLAREIQQQQNEILNQYRQEQFEYNKQKDQEERAYRKQRARMEDYFKAQGLSIQQAKMATDNYFKNLEIQMKLDEKREGKPLSDTQVNTISQMDSAIEDVDRIISTYSNPEYKSYFGVSGFAKRNPITGKFDPTVSQMSQDIDLMRKTVAKAKEGGRLTDQDQRYYEKALMNPNLTQDKFIKLAQRFQDSQKKQRNITLQNYAKQGRNVSNFIDLGYSPSPNTNGTTKQTISEGTIIKNKQGQRMIMRGGKWQAI